MEKRLLHIVLLLLLGGPAIGQLSLVDENPHVIDFNTNLDGVNKGRFAGDGFDPSPMVGELDSDAWSVIGLSENDPLDFGESENSEQFGQGTSSGGESGGGAAEGIWAFLVGPNNPALGVKPNGGDFDPGSITLRVVNNTGSNINTLGVSYKFYYNNDGDASHNFVFSHSDDNISYTELPSLTRVTESSQGGGVNWVEFELNTILDLTSNPIANGSFYYLRWSSEEIVSDTEDELALDDITITPNAMPTPEPDNHVPSFAISGVSLDQMSLQWTESASGQAADGYLVMGRLTSGGSFASVADGIPVLDDSDFADGNGAINLTMGTTTATFTGLNSMTDYDFIIYPYTNSGVLINYKQDGVVPTAFGSTASGTILQSIDFDMTVMDVNNGQFQANGFDPSPSSGQLDSDSWSILGISENDPLDFGESTTTPDFTNGTSQGNVGQSSSEIGIWAFETSTGDYALGFKPDNGAFTPGSIIYRFQNNSGGSLNGIGVSYDFLYNNTGSAAHDFIFSHSDDNSTYVAVPELDALTPELGFGGIDWQSESKSTSIDFASPLTNGSSYYLMWTSDEVETATSEDEMALDNIQIFTIVYPEPFVHVENLAVSALDGSSIQLDWEGAFSSYLILIKETSGGSFASVSDGTPVGDDNDLSNGNGAINLPAGTTSYIFSGLDNSTSYDFIIYPYTNSGLDIDFKTDGMVPTATTSTANELVLQEIDFDNTVANVNNGQFQGSGFSPTPSAGQLDSDSWSVTGIDGGNMVGFGETNTSSDFARGTSTGGASNEGIYAYETSTGDFALGVKPSTGTGSNTFDPGEFILKFNNNTGQSLTTLTVSYDFLYKNTGNDIYTFTFSHSPDNSSYTDVSALDQSTPTGFFGDWVSNFLITTITLADPLSNGADYYFKWTGDNIVTGALDGTDELAIDNIKISQINFPEPTNHVTGFTADMPTGSKLELSWIEPTVGQSPTGYLVLIKENGVGSFATVADGTEVMDDGDLSDGNGAVNLTAGTTSHSFTGLEANTPYDFIIYPYTNLGINIDYKTDGTVPTVSGSTNNVQTLYIIDFDNTLAEVNNGQFQGNGFSPNPSPGQLDSDSWSIRGVGGNDLDFGETSFSSDLAGGTSQGDLGAGSDGIYAFETSTGDFALGFKANDNTSPPVFDPGEIVFKFLNNSGTTLTYVDIDYDFIFNDNRVSAHSFNFSHSADDMTYVDVPALDASTMTGGGPAINWQTESRSTRIQFPTGLPDNAEYYFKWTSEVIGPDDDEDELAVDNIVISGNLDDGITDPEPSEHVSNFVANATGFGSISLTWMESSTGQLPDGYLILVRRGTTQAFPVVNDGIVIVDDSDFNDFIASTNVAFGTDSYTITGLEQGTQYDFLIYPYTNFGLDVDYKTNGTVPSASESTATSGPGDGSTISMGSGAAIINLEDIGDVIAFTFTVTDDINGPKNQTDIEEIIFTQGPGNEIEDWTQLISSAVLEETGCCSVTNLDIYPDRLERTNVPNNLGSISTEQDLQVTLQLKNAPDGILPQTIDGKRLVMELLGTNIVVDTDSNPMAEGTAANSGADNGEIEVTATQIQILHEPSTTGIADVALSQQPVFIATDNNENYDLDFDEDILSISDPGGLIPKNAPDAFIGGFAPFSGFNFEQPGTGTMQVNTASFNSEISNTITITATTNIALISGGVATSPLNCSATDQAVLGFSLTTTGSLVDVSSINIVGSTTDNNINYELHRSTDADFSTSGDNVLVNSTPMVQGGEVLFSSLSESLTDAASNYFLVADVIKNVNSQSLSTTFIVGTVTVSKGSTAGAAAGPDYSFFDNCAPVIENVSFVENLINESNTTQTVVVVYDETMDNTSTPAITLTGSNWGAQAAGSWSTTSVTNDTYTTTLTHNGTEEVIMAERATITPPSGATDLDGTADGGFPMSSDAFEVDTQKPAVTAMITNTSMVLNARSQTVTLTYSEDMNVGSTPVITFTSSNLISNGDGDWQPDQRTWTESFTHNATPELINGATVVVNAQASDVNGNVALTGSIANPTFNIDLLNHAPLIDAVSPDPVVILEDASGQLVDFMGVADGDFNLQTVISVTATSDNTALVPHPDVTYTSGATSGSLTIVPVENANSDDLGTATITLTVTDNGGTTAGGVNMTTTNFVVDVTAVNDPPVVNEASFDIFENSMMGAAVGTVVASDIEDDNLSFSIISGDDNNAFTIDNSGNITVLTPGELNYEDPSKPLAYTLSIQVQDDGDGMPTGVNDVTIDLLDVNDPPNEIILSRTDIPASGDLVTVSVLNMRDEDGDLTVQSFALSPDGGPDNASFSVLNPDPATWTLRTNFGPVQGTSFNIKLRVTDDENAFFDQDFTINVVAAGTEVPSSPTGILINSLNNISINEKIPAGTSIGTLSSQDLNENDAHTYSFATGNGLDDADNALFTIQGDQLVTTTAINFNAQNTYRIRIQTDDNTGQSPFEKSFEIAVIDTPPAIAGTIPANGTTGVAVSDNLLLTLDEVIFAGSGSIVIKRASDNATVESIPIGASAINGVGTTTLTIDPTANLSFSTSYYVEISTGLVQDVTSNNFPGISGSTTWSFETINFVPDDILLSNNEIAQGVPVSSAVGIFTTNDLDETNPHIYTLTEGEGSTDNASFTIDGQTLRSAVVFDAAVQENYSIRVKTDDQRGGTFEEVFTITVTAPSDNTGPVITRTTGFPSSIESGAGSVDLVFSITDADGQVAGVDFKVRSSSDEVEDAITINPEIVEGNYSFTVQESIFDELGITFELTATDNANNSTSDTGMVTVGFTADRDIPALPSGGTETSYRIISIPYELENKSVGAVFDELGAADDSKWRLLQHRANGTCCLEAPTNIPTIEVGEGYWFNQVESTIVSIGEHSTVDNTRDDPFVITLSPGWNMIGDPYPYSVNWSDVVDFNGDPADLEPYRIFNGSFGNGTALEPFKGGFVKWNGSATFPLRIPVKGQGPGRKLVRELTKPLDANHWEVRLELQSDKISNELSAFGMHPDADAGRDRYDESTVPRFFQYLELNFDNELINGKVGKNVLPREDAQTWSFTFNTNLNENVTLRWDNSYFGQNDFDLYLLDVVNGQVIDMREENSYDLGSQDGQVFEIHYGMNLNLGNLLSEKRVVMGDSYPNPFREEVIIPIVLPDISEKYTVNLNIIDLSGRLVYSQEQTALPGEQQLTWNGGSTDGTSSPPGLYLVDLKIESDLVHQKITRKIIKQ